MEKLENIVRNHLSKGIVLMDLVHDNKSDFVRIIIDSPKSIPISETSKIANRIKNDDNILSIFPAGCRLEVGTPGVGTSLKENFQYKKNIGRKISIKYKKDNSVIVSDTFLLIDVSKESVKVRKRDIYLTILFENIVSAKVKVSFD